MSIMQHCRYEYAHSNLARDKLHWHLFLPKKNDAIEQQILIVLQLYCPGTLTLVAIYIFLGHIPLVLHSQPPFPTYSFIA